MAFAETGRGQGPYAVSLNAMGRTWDATPDDAAAAVPAVEENSGWEPWSESQALIHSAREA